MVSQTFDTFPYFSYDIFNILPLLPPSCREISSGGCVLLYNIITGSSTCVKLSISNGQ